VAPVTEAFAQVVRRRRVVSVVATIVDLAAERRRRRAPGPAPGVCGAPALLTFDLCAPQTYLVAERVDRQFPALVWAPVLPAEAPLSDDDLDALADRAHALGLPFVEPEDPYTGAAAAARVAALAAELDRAAPFVLAASRLAWAGGFDLADTDVLIEAAAAAGLDPADALAAAVNRGRDGLLTYATDRIRAVGVRTLPALRVGDRWYEGEPAITAATAGFAPIAAPAPAIERPR